MKVLSAMWKIIVCITLITSLLLLGSTLVFANDETLELSEEEKSTLIKHVGLTEEQIMWLPIPILRELIAEDAKLMSFGEPRTYTFESSNGESTIQSFSSSITLTASAFQVSSSDPSLKKFRLIICNREWELLLMVPSL